MTFSGDPYRILGLAPGASLEDVKRAYRRLAKQYHPDRAGPEALARFIAIQGAYETLAGPGRRARRGGRPEAPRPEAARPSEADPARARATREAYRARRGTAWGTGGAPRSDAGSAEGWWRQGPSRRGPEGSRPGTGTTGADTARAGTAGADAAGADSAGADTARADTAGAGSASADTTSAEGEDARRAGKSPGSARSARSDRERTGTPGGRDGGRGAGGSAAAGSSGPGAGPRRGSQRRKATLTSTSYDDAAREPRHPDWQGASWYGTSSGTYWTINPREYADPRKHGPEYQARARRATADAGSGADGEGSGAGGRGTPGVGVSPPPGSDASSWDSPSSGPYAGSGPDAGSGPYAGSGPREAADPADGVAFAHPSSDNPLPIAGSIGLASGVAVAIPALAVVLGSTMSGDLSLAAAALAVPPIVAVAVGLGVGLLRRGRG